MDSAFPLALSRHLINICVGCLNYLEAQLSRVIESKGKNYADHYATLIDWLMQDVGLPGKAAQGDSTDSSYDIDELEEINRLDYVE